MPARAHGGKQPDITRLVIHATVSACTPGGARANGRWFASAQAGTSAHYVIDPAEVVQCLPEDVTGYHAPPNAGSIGIELCDPQKGSDGRWEDDPHRQMLSLAAELVADLCARHNLPLEYIDAAGLVAGRRGITTHRDVSEAWRKSSHTDPGSGFPMVSFLALARQAAAPITPPSPAKEDDDVTDDQIEQIAQRAAALVRADLRTVLGTDPATADADPTHYSLGDVGRSVATLTRAVNALIGKTTL